MIESYQKLLEMEAIASLKLEQDKKALDKIRNILYQEKDFITDKLISYLKKEFNTDYFEYKFIDIDSNIADILVKTNSQIFKEYIEGKDFVSFSAEELIDFRMFENSDEIILIDLNSDEKFLNLGYICDSLNYNYLSYVDKLKEKLSIFINYVINRNICNK